MTTLLPIWGLIDAPVRFDRTNVIRVVLDAITRQAVCTSEEADYSSAVLVRDARTEMLATALHCAALPYTRCDDVTLELESPGMLAGQG